MMLPLDKNVNRQIEPTRRNKNLNKNLKYDLSPLTLVEFIDLIMIVQYTIKN